MPNYKNIPFSITYVKFTKEVSDYIVQSQLCPWSLDSWVPIPRLHWSSRTISPNRSIPCSITSHEGKILHDSASSAEYGAVSPILLRSFLAWNIHDLYFIDAVSRCLLCFVRRAILGLSTFVHCLERATKRTAKTSPGLAWNSARACAFRSKHL